MDAVYSPIVPERPKLPRSFKARCGSRFLKKLERYLRFSRNQENGHISGSEEMSVNGYERSIDVGERVSAAGSLT